MGHPSRYGPDWAVSSRSGGSDGGDCIHLAKVTDAVREQYRRQYGGGSLRVGTTHVARDEHGNWLELTAGEAWAWVRGAKAGDFDHLFDTPPDAAPNVDIPAGNSPLAHINVIVGNAKTLDEDQTARIRGVLLDALAAEREWSCSA